MTEGEKLFGKIQDYYCINSELNGHMVLKKNRLFLQTGGKTWLQNVWRGLHIANEDLTLTIEGAQLLHPHITKNIVEVSHDDFTKYFSGEDIELKGLEGPVVLGVGGLKFAPALGDGECLKNILPKSRLIK